MTGGKKVTRPKQTTAGNNSQTPKPPRPLPTSGKVG